MTRPSPASLAVIAAGAVALYLASRHPWEAALVWTVCAMAVAALEGTTRRSCRDAGGQHGRRDWADNAQLIQGAMTAPRTGHPAETNDEGDSHDHAV